MICLRTRKQLGVGTFDKHLYVCILQIYFSTIHVYFVESMSFYGLIGSICVAGHKEASLCELNEAIQEEIGNKNDVLEPGHCSNNVPSTVARKIEEMAKPLLAAVRMPQGNWNNCVPISVAGSPQHLLQHFTEIFAEILRALRASLRPQARQ